MRHLTRSLFEQGFANFSADNIDFTADIKDQKDEYLLIVDLPRLDKENIELNCDNSVLSIRAHHEQEKASRKIIVNK